MGWLALLAMIVIGRWQLARLRGLAVATAPPGEVVDGPTVSVIVPARNEAGSLPNLLASLQRQERLPDEVVVVDDASEDDTLAIAQRFGARASTVAERPDGWLGKPWACWHGARTARGDLLVFLDADVVLAPDAISRLLATYRLQDGGLLSVQPHHDAPRWWEQASAFPNLVSVMATGALRHRGPRPPIAFGPCLVTDRPSYERAGTHAAVAREVIEDLALGRAYAEAGLPVRSGVGETSVRFRMYPEGPRQLIEGWTKNLAGGPGFAPPLALAIAVAWVLAASSTIGTVVSALGAGRWPVALATWAAAAATLSWMLARIGRFRWWAGPAYPLLWLAFVALFVRSAWHRARGTVAWRGRRVAAKAT